MDTSQLTSAFDEAATQCIVQQFGHLVRALESANGPTEVSEAYVLFNRGMDFINNAYEAAKERIATNGWKYEGHDLKTK